MKPNEKSEMSKKPETGKESEQDKKSNPSGEMANRPDGEKKSEGSGGQSKSTTSPKR